MKKLITMIFILAVSISCQAQDGSTKFSSQDKMKYFGEKIDPKGAIPVTQLKAKLGDQSEMTNIKLMGEIESCCAKKGCWMKLKNGDEASVRVTFKDYGFFVPLDSGGKKTIIQGKAYYKITSVADLRHYAEDAGKSKKEIRKIKKPKKELCFEAVGVIIM